MKVAAIIYHKNADKLYHPRWIQKSIDSIMNQNVEMDVWELNYGGQNVFYYPEDLAYQYSMDLENHVAAQNILLNDLFDRGYNYILNNNLDDISLPNRYEVQLGYAPQYDVVSSDFAYIQDQGGQDVLTHNLRVSEHNHEIGAKLANNENVIAHPAVCYSKSFWQRFGPYDDQTIPREDLLLWQKASQAGARFYIVPQILLHYRRHPMQICK